MAPATEFLLGKHDLQRFNFTYIYFPAAPLPQGLRSLDIPQKAAPMCPEATAYHVVTCHPCLQSVWGILEVNLLVCLLGLEIRILVAKGLQCSISLRISNKSDFFSASPTLCTLFSSFLH